MGDPEALETRLQAYRHAVIRIASAGKEGPEPRGSWERLADVRGSNREVGPDTGLGLLGHCVAAGRGREESERHSAKATGAPGQAGGDCSGQVEPQSPHLGPAIPSAPTLPSGHTVNKTKIIKRLYFLVPLRLW